MDEQTTHHRPSCVGNEITEVRPEAGVPEITAAAELISTVETSNSDTNRLATVVSRAPRPFVWQHDRRLLLLDEEASVWVLAELEFEPAVCRYREIRRAAYGWEREAAGALLSRALAFGLEAAEDSATHLANWLAGHRDVVQTTS